MAVYLPAFAQTYHLSTHLMVFPFSFRMMRPLQVTRMAEIDQGTPDCLHTK
jgi:hypothetical protein